MASLSHLFWPFARSFLPVSSPESSSVISLPSKQDGGDTIACHHGETKSFVTAAGSAYRMNYIAW